MIQLFYSYLQTMLPLNPSALLHSADGFLLQFKNLHIYLFTCIFNRKLLGGY